MLPYEVMLTSFYLNYLFKGPVSKYSHILRSGRLELQHMNLEGDKVWPIMLGNRKEKVTEKVTNCFYPSFLSSLALIPLKHVAYHSLLIPVRSLMGFSGSFPIFFPLSFWLMSTLETHYPRQSDYGSVEKFPKKKS